MKLKKPGTIMLVCDELSIKDTVEKEIKYIMDGYDVIRAVIPKKNFSSKIEEAEYFSHLYAKIKDCVGVVIFNQIRRIGTKMQNFVKRAKECNVTVIYNKAPSFAAVVSVIGSTPSDVDAIIESDNDNSLIGKNDEVLRIHLSNIDTRSNKEINKDLEPDEIANRYLDIYKRFLNISDRIIFSKDASNFSDTDKNGLQMNEFIHHLHYMYENQVVEVIYAYGDE